MPKTERSPPVIRTLEDVVASAGGYSIDAFHFVGEGLQVVAERAHGPTTRATAKPHTRHITGGQLCHGLREIAQERWGLMAPAVLGVWGIRSTLDVGRIVFAMIEAGIWQKTPNDRLADFADVFDFRKAFVEGYAVALPDRIE